MKSLEARRYRHALLGAYAVALLVLTLAPMPATGGLATGLDKLIHVGLFGALAMLVHWNLVPTMHRSLAATVAFLSAVLTAGMIEILQDPLPYRDGDLLDFLAGTAGGVLGAVAATLISERGH